MSSIMSYQPITSQVECRVCYRPFASTFSRRRHEKLHDRDDDHIGGGSSALKQVTTPSAKESADELSHPESKSKAGTKLIDEKSAIEDSNQSETDSDSNDSDDSDEGDEKNNVWLILLQILSFRINNDYYDDTILYKLKNVDQLWDPPYYEELIYILRELVQSFRKINRLLNNDPVMEKIEEKIKSLRGKYKDDSLLDENDIKEMAWEKLNFLVKAALQRNIEVSPGDDTDSNMDAADGNIETAKNQSENSDTISS